MSPSARKDSRLIVGGVPRAELLPPELELEKKARAQRRGLFFIVVLVIGAVGVAYALTIGYAAGVQAQVDAENARTADLLAQQGQYIEVRQLAAQVAAAEEARRVGTSTEIDWNDYLTQVATAFSNSGVASLSFTVKTSTPLAPFGDASKPLENPRVAEIVISGYSPTLPNLAAVLDELEKLPGFADAAPGAVSNSGGIYSFTVTLHINSEAYTGRFAQEENE